MRLKPFLNICVVFLIGWPAWADPILPSQPQFYYGGVGRSSDPLSLKDELHKILQAFHISKPGDFDQIVESCSVETNEYCYTHRRLSYKEARQYMFGHLFLHGLQNQNYWLPTVYCQDKLTNQQLPEGNALGPMKIPYAQVVNAEHAWPQSKFSNNMPKALQKSDLHSLYPVRMKVNSTRGNHPFGEVVEAKSVPCEEAALGKNEKGQTVFEPSPSIQGNIARSLFYFSIRYNTPIDPDQEKVLRTWHKNDPVDSEELEKHEETFRIQYVRNPFIDHPEWVDTINNF